MTELKTLKDIGKDTRFCSKLPMFARSELRNYLKQEAIKEIKDFREDEEEGELMKKFYIDEKTGWDLIEYIMWKNNITEEDLK